MTGIYRIAAPYLDKTWTAIAVKSADEAHTKAIRAHENGCASDAWEILPDICKKLRTHANHKEGETK